MNKNLYKLFGAFIGVCGVFLINGVFNFNLIKPIVPHFNKTYTIAEKKEILFNLGEDLKENYGLKISPSTFADAAIIVLWCESELSTTATSVDGYDSQGINQLTADTRQKLGIPKDIKDDDFATQVQYFKKYLIATGKIPQIQNSVSLHCMNFSPKSSPAAQTFCTAKGCLRNLDLNKNGQIDRKDFFIFQRKRTEKNPTMAKIFFQHYSK